MQTIEDFKNYFDEILNKVQAKNLLKNSLQIKDDFLIFENQKIKLPKDKKIYLFGSGKAVLNMSWAIYELIEERIEKALLVGPYENSLKKSNLTYLKSSHPLPTNASLEASLKMIEEFKKLNEDDFFIYLLSGGTSALLELPCENISLEDFKKCTDLMLKGAMPIDAMNCVRKHISSVKGGRLATFTKAKGVVLTLSDVLKDNLQTIGSAPLYFDSTSFEDAINYLKEYGVFEQIPNSIKEYLLKGLENKVEETPKNKPTHINHLLVGTNDVLLKTTQKVLKEKNIDSVIIDKKISSNIDEELNYLLDFINENKKGCFIFGGEATVKVKGDGKGGRNQHLVLSFLNSFPKDKEILFLSGASDGIDGNSSSAGAVVDNSVLEFIKENDLDIKSYLENFDSNTFLDKCGCLLKTGESHNNILDVVIVYIKDNKEL